jgi:hypothetical protein
MTKIHYYGSKTFFWLITFFTLIAPASAGLFWEVPEFLILVLSSPFWVMLCMKNVAIQRGKKLYRLVLKGSWTAPLVFSALSLWIIGAFLIFLRGIEISITQVSPIFDGRSGPSLSS